MKKHSFRITHVALSIIFAFFAVAQSASAQVKFGVKGGIDVSQMSVDSDVFKAKNRAGFFLGFTTMANLKALGVANLGIDASALYEQRNAKLEVKTDRGLSSSVVSPDITRKAIVIPVNVRLGIGAGETVQAYLKAGPQVSFNMGDDKIEWKNAEEKLTAAVKDTEYSANIGAGLMFFSKLEVSANYNIVMGNSIKDFNKENYDSNVKYTWKNLKNNAWQISSTWYF